MGAPFSLPDPIGFTVAEWATRGTAGWLLNALNYSLLEARPVWIELSCGALLLLSWNCEGALVVEEIGHDD